MIDLFQTLFQAVDDLLSGKADRRQGLIAAGAILIGLVFLAMIIMGFMHLKGR
ncbi:MAG: hypothetical protein IPH30_16610 [Betaproteobacteria bacterium]|nr:hypothetical protein [Betaproteobacteria bacterium]